MSSVPAFVWQMEGVVMVEVRKTFLHFFHQIRSDHRSPRSKSAPPMDKRWSDPEPFPLYAANEQEIRSEQSDVRETRSEPSMGKSDSEQSATSINYEQWEDWMDNEDIYTVMIRNIPCSCKRDHIIEAIQTLGFQDSHEFFYVPTRNGKTRGYAFLGFADPSVTRQFVKKMTGHKFPGKTSSKFITVVPASIQGFRKNLSHFESTSVMKNRDAKPVFRNT